MANSIQDITKQIITDKTSSRLFITEEASLSKLMNDAGIPGLSVATLNQQGDISPFFLGTVNSTQCGFLKMPQMPTYAEQQKLNKSYYILTLDGLFYFNKAREELAQLELAYAELAKLGKRFKQKDILSDEELEVITSLTNHSHSSPSERVNEETIFGAASLSKPVFAYLVLKLIEINKTNEGKPGLGKFSKQFDLDTPLCDVFPDLLTKFRQEDHDNAGLLTTKMVLSHTTGLPITHDERQGAISFQFIPGTRYGYSGPGIACLQETIEALTGAKLELLAKEHVFLPCGMTHSTYEPLKQQPELTAQAANSLRTTPSDYAKFIHKWLNDPQVLYAFVPNKFMTEDYLPEDWIIDVRAQSEDKACVAWGLGWGMQVDEQGKKAYHSGDMNEWRTWVAVDLEQKSAVVYFANSHNGHILAEQIISPHIHLEHVFNYFFQTYGFARRFEELEERTNFHGVQPSRFKPLELELMREQAQVPGLSIATLTPTGIISTQTAGVLNKETEQEVSKETVFEAASLSKPVFAYLILKMAERGELALDTPIYEQFGDFGPSYAPIRKPEEFYQDKDFANNYKALTPRMILSHQAGLPNEFDPKQQETFCYVSSIGKQFDYSGEAYRFLQEIVERIKPGYALALISDINTLEPGILYVSYQKGGLAYQVINPWGESIQDNIDDEELRNHLDLDDLTVFQPFTLQSLTPYLAQILQITTARGYTLPSLEVLAQHEFAKLGMTHSSFLPPRTATSQAVGHLSDGTVDTNRHFFGIHPAASLYTTAKDYGVFLRACVNDLFINEQMFTPVVTNLAGKDNKAIKAKVDITTLQQIAWGVGIGLQKNNDECQLAFHWGDNNTCRNFAAINLSTLQAIVCFTNSANGPALFKQVIEPAINVDMTPTFNWLYTREGFNCQENVTVLFRDSLVRMKQAETLAIDLAVSISTPNPYAMTPNLLNQ